MPEEDKIDIDTAERLSTRIQFGDGTWASKKHGDIRVDKHGNKIMVMIFTPGSTMVQQYPKIRREFRDNGEVMRKYSAKDWDILNNSEYARVEGITCNPEGGKTAYTEKEYIDKMKEQLGNAESKIKTVTIENAKLRKDNKTLAQRYFDMDDFTKKVSDRINTILAQRALGGGEQQP